jgi:hypothetical protein
MIPFLYFSWPPALWMNWWRHAGDGNRIPSGPASVPVSATITAAVQPAPAQPVPAASIPIPPISVAPSLATPILGVPLPSASSMNFADSQIIEPPPASEPEVADRIIPFPFERVNRRARILARSAELIILGAPRPA